MSDRDASYSDHESMPFVGMVRLLSMLPLFAWPLGCRIALWIATAAMVAGGIHLWNGLIGEPSSDATPEAEALLRHQIADAQQRIADLAPLRQQVAKYERLTTPSEAAPAARASGVRTARTAVSSAGLLAWIEQQVLATGVSLQRFDPVAQSEQSDAAGRDSFMSEADAFERPRGPARLPIVRSAQIDVEGHYPALYRFLQALATTMPPLLIDVFHLRPASGADAVADRSASTPDAGTGRRGIGAAAPFGSGAGIGTGPDARTGAGSVDDTGRLMLTARVDLVEAGRFRLVGGGQGAGATSAGAPRVDPFARRGLPDRAVGARLLGVMASGRRQSALIAVGSEVLLVGIGQMVGDARVEKIGKDFVTLAPLVGLPLRTLVLRSEP